MRKLLSLINGWKTYSGAAVLFLTGAVDLINAVNGQGDAVSAISVMAAAVMGTGLKHATTKVGQ